jgi:menaquinone-dependent protoporphyrinogen oxidase
VWFIFFAIESWKLALQGGNNKRTNAKKKGLSKYSYSDNYTHTDELSKSYGLFTKRRKLMKKDRRRFLKLGGTTLLLSMGAFNFGYSLQSLVGDNNKKVALIYATRYESTKDTAEWIAEGLNRKVDILDIEKISFDDTAKNYDFIIIGSGVWSGGVHKDMLKFLDTQKQRLNDKIIASFILCGTTDKTLKGKKRIEGYFTQLHTSLNKKPAINENFGGRMQIDKLNEKDRKMLTVFYEKVLKKEFVNWDRTEPKKAQQFGKKLLSFDQ